MTDDHRKYWLIELDEEQKKQLDLELIDQLNQLEEDGDNDEEQDDNSQSDWIFNIIGVVLIIAFLIFSLGNVVRYNWDHPRDFWLPAKELAQLEEYQKLQEAVVSIQVSGGSGTGFNISERGLIITNYHVLRGKQWADVRFGPSQLYRSTQWRSLPEIDLAIMDIGGQELPTASLAKGYELEIGEKVIIIGNPLGFAKLIVEGEIIGYRNLPYWEQPVLLIDAPIHSGSSGSPVFNKDGEVVGIIFATLRNSGRAQEQTFGLAIPVEYLISNMELELE